MTWDYKLVTAPATLPLKMAELKAALSVDALQDDYTLYRYLQSATEEVELMTNRRLITQTWDLFLSEFPNKEDLRLPFGKLQSITTFQWTLSDGTTSSWTVSGSDLVSGSTTKAHIDTSSDPGKLTLKYNENWPTDTLKTSNPIQIRFTCGYGAASTVPQPLKNAIILLVKEKYDPSQPMPVTPFGRGYTDRAVEALISQYRINGYGFKV